MLGGFPVDVLHKVSGCLSYRVDSDSDSDSDSVADNVPLVSRARKQTQRVRTAEPKSILKANVRHSFEESVNSDALPTRSIKEMAECLTVSLGDVKVYPGCTWESCLHGLAECWRGFCTGTDDEQWLDIFGKLAADSWSLNDSQLQEYDLEKLVTIWQFSIFLYALFHEHYCQNERAVESKTFMYVEELLQGLTKKLLLAKGKAFFKCLEMDSLKKESFRDLPGMSPVVKYSFLPIKLNSYVNQTDSPNLPVFLRTLLQAKASDESELLSKRLNTLNFSEQERVSFECFNDLKVPPHIYGSAVPGPYLRSVPGFYGCPRRPTTLTCHIGALIHGLAHCHLDANSSLADSAEGEKEKTIQSIRTEFREICCAITKKIEVNEARYFKFIKSLIYAQLKYHITILECFSFTEECFSNLQMDWVESRDIWYLQAVKVSGSPEFLSFFGRYILKLHENPTCSFIRSIEQDAFWGDPVRAYGDQWAFVLDVSIPENIPVDTGLDLQDLINGELASVLLYGSSLDTGRSVLKARKSDFRVMIIHPKTQDSNVRRRQAGEALLRGVDDVISMNFQDIDSGQVEKIYFEKISCIYYNEYSYESTGTSGQNFTTHGHFQVTVKEEDRWIMFNDDKASEMRDPGQGFTDHHFRCGHPVLYFYSKISLEEYQLRLARSYADIQPVYPDAAIQYDDLEAISLV